MTNFGVVIENPINLGCVTLLVQVMILVYRVEESLPFALNVLAGIFRKLNP